VPVTEPYHGASELERVAGEREAWARAFEGLWLDLARCLRERSALQERLDRGETRYQRSLEAAELGLWDWRVGDPGLTIAPNLLRTLGYRPEEAPTELTFWIRAILPADRLALIKAARAMIAGRGKVYETELRMRRRDGRVRWFYLRCTLETKGENEHWIIGSHTDITRRKLAEQEVISLQREALVNAHAAGKAEFATTVLHNIGNVLNSVNVDSAEIRRGVRAMRLDRLKLALEMITEHRDNLAAFFASEKGQKLETYLAKVIEAAARESELVAGHTEEIHKKIEIARDIIETQQSYAKGNELQKKNLVQLVDEALEIQHESIKKRGILLEKRYGVVRPVAVPSAKMIHLLINLVKNAVESLSQAPRENRTLTVSLREETDAVAISITDNGIGIAPEHLPKMFTHGFTTKKHGHGFGLRYCAKTARELGGEITAVSEGKGKGACFTVTLPLEGSRL